MNFGDHDPQNPPSAESYTLSSDLILNGQTIPIIQTLILMQIGNGQFQVELSEYVTSISLVSVGTVTLRVFGGISQAPSNSSPGRLQRTAFTLTSEATSVPEPGAIGVFALGLFGLSILRRPRLLRDRGRTHRPQDEKA